MDDESNQKPPYALQKIAFFALALLTIAVPLWLAFLLVAFLTKLVF